MINREDGILDHIMLGGTEIRLHRFERGVVKRIPWHKDFVTGEWFSGIEGPEVRVDALRELLR